MRSSKAVFCGFAAFAILSGTGTGGFGTARAQDVVVNPQAVGQQVLLYPGGQYARVVPDLLWPGQKSDPIRLHMPSQRRPVRVSQAPQPATPKPAAPKPTPKLAKAEPAPAPPPAASYSNSLGPGSLFGGPAMTFTPNNPAQSQGQSQSQPQSQPQKESRTEPAPKPPTRLAKANPAPLETPVPGLTRRSVILFAKDATEPVESAMDQIRFLASDLNAAMVRPASRIELQAYGGQRGDKGSDARRLSLKRALAIRQVLIDDGVEPGRIDVRAMGGADNGPSDRVDIFVKA